jgi:lipopolysaccharide biosynthesis glycosyltransferase
MPTPSGRSNLRRATRAGRQFTGRAARRIARLADGATAVPPPVTAVLPKPKRDARLTSYAYAYRRLLALVHDVEPDELRKLTFRAPPADDLKSASALLAATRAEAQLAERLRRGETFSHAVIGSVRQLLAAGQHVTARALSQALEDSEETQGTGRLAAALVALQRGLIELAWADFTGVPRGLWVEHAPAEYVHTAFLADPTEAIAEVRRLLDERPPSVDADAWTGMAYAAFGVQEHELAAHLIEAADQSPEDLSARNVRRVEWLRPWLERAAHPPAPPEVPAGHVAFGVIDYKQPDYEQMSSNLGDYVQTIAALGHVVRHQGLTFHGDPELADVLTELQGRVKPERAVDGPPADVTLVALNRDATNLDAVPVGTWSVVFGWYMQSQFKMRHDFPLNPAIRPIFVSFHVNRRELLTPESIDYLKANAPIGCRDWTTVDLLLSVDVPAFFSGCITTTVDTVFPEDDRPVPPKGLATAYVDVKLDQVPKKNWDQRLTQAEESVRVTSFGPNMRDALDMLERYRRDFSYIITTRLHCYLPARSLGMPVDFSPRNRADIRFNGLLDLTPEQLDEIRQGISDKLRAVLEVVWSGAEVDEVRAAWREVCADDVAKAVERRASVPPLPPPSFDVSAACAVVSGGSVHVPRSVGLAEGEEVNVALALDGNLREQLLVVIDGLVENTVRPLHLWILSRDHGPEDHDRLAAIFPEASFTWLPCDEVDYGPVLGMLRHITVSTMDRLLLPDLLPDIERVVYHDIDALCVTDIGPLYDTFLDGHPLAARSAIAMGTVSGFGNIYRSGKRLTPEEAFDLYRRMHARFRFDFVSFNAGILVLDLAHMRADDFCRSFLPYVEHYGMNDQEILNCYAGPNRTFLDPRWNSVAAQEPVTDPWIIHWAGPSKPWGSDYILFRRRWQAQEVTLAERVRRVPVG